MLLAPGPIEVVHAIIRRRACALAKAIAACAIACSWWARRVGSLRRAACSAGPSPATLPWPKIAHTPAKRGTSLSMYWAARKRTSASAIDMRTIANRALPRFIIHKQDAGNRPVRCRPHRPDPRFQYRRLEGRAAALRRRRERGRGAKARRAIRREGGEREGSVYVDDVAQP